MRKPRPTVELLARLLPRGAFVRLYGRAKTGAWPNLRDPRRFSERLLRRLLDPGDELPLMVRTGDKYTLRGYVEERLGSGYLPELHDVIERNERITAARLASWPERAVLKASHASRWMAFIDPSSDDPDVLDGLVRTWLARSYAGVRQEPHYALMTPRAVLEEDLRRDGDPPPDLKFFVIDGVTRFIMRDSTRFRGLRRFITDDEWRPLAVRYPISVGTDALPPEVEPPPPATLAHMRDAATVLAEGLGFVRVDFYEVDGRPLVGEMTHFPSAGAPRFVPRSFDAELGAVWRERRPIDARWRCAAAGGDR